MGKVLFPTNNFFSTTLLKGHGHLFKFYPFAPNLVCIMLSNGKNNLHAICVIEKNYRSYNPFAIQTRLKLCFYSYRLNLGVKSFK
jgi:hypothetical protein